LQFSALPPGINPFAVNNDDDNNNNNLLLLLQSALQPLVGFRPAQLSLNILSRKVLQSAIASGTSNPQLGGEPGI
jgi:pyruvate-formate lyase